MGFDTVLTTTLAAEGGFTSNDVSPTNMGIRQDVYDAYTAEKKLPKTDVRELSKNYDAVRTFYKDEYWDKPKLNELPEKTASVLFDYGVNAGTGTAVKKLQEIVGTTPDGVIGKKTIAAVNKYVEDNGEDLLAHSILNKRAEQYVQLATKNPAKYEKYLEGWMNRINKQKQINGLNELVP
jgi:lysozyme family protein